MKKLLPLCAIFVMSIIIIWIFGANASDRRFEPKRHVETVRIQNTLKITLDFQLAKDIQVLGWDKNDVEVQINNRIYNGDKPVIEAKDNYITLKSNFKAERRGLITQTLWSWLPLLQFEKYRNMMNDAAHSFMEDDFIIYLPQDTPVDIRTGELTVRNCKLASLSARNATVRNCTFLKGFSGTTGEISVRDSILSKDIQINSQSSNFENITYQND